MVRKRSKGAKRHFESEDEPETESDFEEEPTTNVEKKYSLRQRTKTTFMSDDYEYEDEYLPKPKSDDEEFSNENKEVETEAKDENVDTVKAEESGENADELVDFEDMIRADIVRVDKTNIDYDNIIQKTEIKLQPLPASEKVVPRHIKQQKAIIKKPTKGKRGRKPKKKPSEYDEPQYFAPQIQENESDEDYHPYKPKRTRKPKARPAGEIDSSLLEDVDDYEFEDRDDADYNPEDDMEYPGLELSSYILDKQITEDIDTTNSYENDKSVTNKEDSTADSSVLVISAAETSQNQSLPLDDTAAETSQNQSLPLDNTVKGTTIPEPSIPDLSAKEEQSEVPDDQLDSSNAEKVTSSSQETPEAMVQMNGSVKHIDAPQDESDDDIVCVDDEKKCEIIVLDD